MDKLYDISDIKMIDKSSGHYFFSKGAMNFFDSHILPTVYQGVGGVFFVTSEQPPHGPRVYNVRQFFPQHRQHLARRGTHEVHAQASAEVGSGVCRRSDGSMISLDDLRRQVHFL